MNKKLRKLFSLLLAVLMVSSVIPADFTRPVKAEAATTTAAADYGLLDKACDGLILHCWNWSYNNIKDSMADIAAAGYTSLQTSPVQMPKDAGSSDTQSTWWKVYQPTTLSMVDHPWFGTKAEFKAMCDEAEKYGIKVIVDIVANHMANNTGKLGNCTSDICSQNDPTFRDDESCWHLNGSTGIDYNNQHRNGDTSSLTWGFGGWPDLNTGSTKVQNAIISLLKECVDLGADGFRFDAAKHIELPTDPGGASDFWPNVTSAIKAYDPDVYLYGEILDDSATSISNYTKYIAVTDNRAGNSTSWGIKNGDIGAAANSTLYYSGEAGDNIVLWAESHDTYANDDFTGPSTNLSQDIINRSWCIQAARDFAVLYYVRPGSTSAKMGTKSTNTAWKDTQVVAVNKFHNYFSGKSEYMSSYDNSVVMVERGSKTAEGGVVLVNIYGGSKTVSSATTHLLADGTYKDQITEATFTVSGGKISGNIGSTGVAVVYNAEVKPANTISQAGGKFTSDTLTLTLGLSNATSGTYQIGSAAAQTYTGTKTVTIGGDMAYGDTVTIKLTATDGSQTTNASYTFTKSEEQSYVAYLSKPSGWGSTVYCYAYDDSGTTVINNGVWPGVAMTLDSASGYYKCEMPDTMQSPKVIFTDGTNQYPGAQQPGLEFTASSMLYKDGSWSAYASTEGKVNVKYTDEAGTVLDSLTLTGTIGASYTTTAKTISGYTLKTTPSNATGTYTSSTITVTYVYSKNASTDPAVTSSLATGSSFKTETQTITLTLSNAVSGTYSVDDGPVKTFTGTANVVLGQGKVADSTVTVKATATNSAGTTVTETFTYKKVFNGTVNEAANTVSTTALASTGTLASQYSTNKAGVGAKKTISVDGDLSDWDSSMLIAQGAANDDPRVYRPNSMYELPIDLYALYGAYDDNNLYLMWEMTNVQDEVAPNDNYPLSQGILWQTQELPFFIAVDTGDSSTAIGNNGELQTGGTIWDSGMTIKNSFNKLISINTKGGNGPWVYGGDSTGLDKVEILDASTSNIKMNYGLGILSENVIGINKAYGTYNNRVIGDMCDESADWVDFNTLNHSSSTMDFFYELSIPFDELGITVSDVEKNGVGVLLVATFGKSAMDCLPYDLSMNDNADQADTGSQENNSLEKSDEDFITTSFARIGKSGSVDPEELELNFGADKSSPQSVNTKLTLNGIAEGGTAPYTYKFYVNGSLVGTKTNVTTATVDWTPTSAGTYTIMCECTDAAGDKVVSSKFYTVESTSTSALAVTASVSNATPALGSSITVTANATGGSGSYTYSYLIWNTDTNTWFRVNDTFVSTNTYTWKVSSLGNRKFYVEVKDSTGTVVRSSAVAVTPQSAAALAVKASVNNATPTLGSSVILTANATGGSGSYTYSYLIWNTDTNTWFRSNATFVSTNTYTWKASSLGNRKFYAEVKDSTGTVVRSSAVAVTPQSATAALAVTASVNNATPTLGSSVTLTAKATGGSGSYTYSYLIWNTDTDTWFRANTTFVSTNTYTWKASSLGNRKFYAEVKDSTGKVVRSSAVVVTPQSSTAALAISVSADATGIYAGSSVTLTAKATGGSGTYTYSYLVYNPATTEWYRFSDFKAANTLTWKSSSAGSRKFYAEVKDSTGKVVRSSAVTVSIR